ncbi:hypothetical protein ACFLZ5_08050 [Thermodesulfobacteriota bacterium]
MKVYTLIFYLIVLLLEGCTHQPQLWEKSGGSQQSFDLDSRECEIIGRQVSLLQSETGKNVDPSFFSNTYRECLTAKGWNKKIVVSEPEKESGQETVQHLAELINANTLKGFEQTVAVPDTYKLLTKKQFQSGTTLINQFFWKGKDSSYINILFQENIGANFEQLPYPVSAPNILYTSGEGEKSGERFQWATFFGHIGSDWVMGTGAYYFVSKKQRIIVVISMPLAHPSGTPPQNTTLTRNQFLEIEQFSDQWQLWLNQQFNKGPGIVKQFIQALNFGKQ